MSSIHQKIKAGRERLSMSMEQFAEAVGVSWQSVQQWERGATAPKRTRLQKVAEVIGVSAVSLLSDDAGASDAAPSPVEAAQFSEDWTIEQMMAALAAKMLREAHPADIEAAPSDLKRMIEKSRDPDARIQKSPARQPMPDRLQSNDGRRR